MLDFDSFADRIVTLVGLAEHGEGVPNPYSDLYKEVGLDSIQAFRLLVVIESLAGADVPPLEVPQILTLADAYAYYESLVNDAGN